MSLDNLGQFRQLRRRQTRLRTFRPMVEEPVWPVGVEAMDPIEQRLLIHAADPRRFAAILAVAHGGQRQKPTALVHVCPGCSVACSSNACKRGDLRIARCRR
jgi:hypothetical protein